MRIALFDDWRVGMVDENGIVDITRFVDGWEPVWPYSWMLEFIAKFDKVRPDILAYCRGVTHKRPLDSIRLRPPVPSPSKIIAAPVNYRLHQEEMGGMAGVYPGASIKTIAHYGLFLKPPSSIIGPHDHITLPFAHRRTDHEAEVGVIIGKTLKNVTESQARDAIFGITGLLDLSVRGQEDRPFRKGFDGFCPIGPWIMTRDEVTDFDDIRFELRVNGQRRQKGHTRDMIYGILRLVALASYQTTLYPGDIIASGTPAGVGEIQPGDRLELTIEKLGQLEVRVEPTYAEPPANMGEWFDTFKVAQGAPG